MRVAALALAIALASAPAAAQDAAAQDAAAQDAAAQDAAAARLAALAEHALTAPDDAASWAELARTLPELALSGRASLAETFEAARIADSLALAARGAPLGALPGARPSPLAGALPKVELTAGPRGPAASSHPESAERAGAPAVAVVTGALALLALGITAVALVARRSRIRSAPKPARRARPGLVWTMRSLAGSGADVAEVARRTGMAREAVGLALRLRRPGDRRVA